MKKQAVVMDAETMRRSIARITHEILEKNKGSGGLIVAGIKTRGAVLGKRIADKLSEMEGVSVPFFALDTAAFRDDRTKDRPCVLTLPMCVQEQHVILADDVINTGRTARAAMDAVISAGRPKMISLAALIDRGYRELPIRPDFVGKNIPTAASQVVNVHFMETDGKDLVTIADKNERLGEFL